jgi:hypothetical protein
MESRAISTSLLLLAFAALMAMPAFAVAQPVHRPRPTCGLRPQEWCSPPPGDPCGRHRNAAACRADPACYGMRYRGESVVACQVDERGFGINCPTVGCTSTPPQR